MADNVQWIKLKVGTFDGNSFKKIKRAKIGGVSYRDKLTAVWFELLDLAGKCNADGFLIENKEIPYQSFEDIAIMLDREEKEIELCMQFFIKERMVEIIDDIYCLTNFMQYQNKDGLDKIREQNRERQQRFRDKKKELLIDNKGDSNVTDNVTSRKSSISISSSNSKSNYNINIIKEYNFSNNIEEAIQEWLKYKKEKHQTYKEIGFKKLLSGIQKDISEYGEDYVVDAINRSIANNWSGIYGDKDFKNEKQKEDKFQKVYDKIMKEAEEEDERYNLLQIK